MKNKIATLGPEYSYSHIITLDKFPDSEIIFCSTIDEIFKKVAEEEVDFGVSPFENMIHGQVREALTGLVKNDLRISRAMDLKVRHCLASKKPEFKEVTSHPQALGQCSEFLEDLKEKGIKVKETTSTSRAMEIASTEEGVAAIGSSAAAQHFGLKILESNIGNSKDNVTRFIVVSNNENKTISGENVRTSLILIPGEDRAGLLFAILSPLAKEGINLTRIESIPSGDKLGKYRFYIEFDGSFGEDRVKKALDQLRKNVEVDFLGSYNIE